MKRSPRGRLFKIYKKLFALYGPQGWWPGRSRLEIIVGAILTQHTAWTNVEKAIKSLKEAGALTSPACINSMRRDKLARLIRPAGYYNVKASRLKNFFDLLHKSYKGNIAGMGKAPTEELRRDLIQVNGIGPETCDSILLYAFNRPVFVVDAYTKRIFSRHKLCGRDAEYGIVQNLFMRNLPHSVRIYNEYHALIVRLAKEFCRTKPRCAACPLRSLSRAAIVCA